MKSNCCDAEIIQETDLCSDCKEHCELKYSSEDLEDLPFEEQIKIIEELK